MKNFENQRIEDALDTALGHPGNQMPGTRPDLTQEAEQISGLLAPFLQILPEADPPDDLFDAIEATLDAEGAEPVQSLRAEDGHWEKCSEKIWQKRLARDPASGRSTYLLRCLPGASIPSHLHKRAEHIVILEGELWMGGQLFGPGDAQIAMANSQHPEVTMPNGCLVLISA